MRAALGLLALVASLLALGCGARTPFYERGDAAVRDAPFTDAPFTDTPFTDAPIGSDRTTVCADFQTLCRGMCVDTRSDPANCGGCGLGCGDSVCVNGGCIRNTCPRPASLCGVRCFDLQNDSSNCGACNVACAPGAVCRVGRCIFDCGAPGRTSCGGTCTDLTVDPANCGACGRSCGPGAICSRGACGSPCSPPATTFCSGRCVDVLSDPANCGACFRACGHGQTCTRATCVNVTPLTGSPFRITSLDPTGCFSVEHNMVTGDDRGGIAVSPSSVFYTGDSATGRFDLDMLFGNSIGRQYDALTGNLHDGQVYTLASGAAPIGMMGGLVTGLELIDGATGRLTGTVIPLSQSIMLSPAGGGGVGIFAGYDRVALLGNGRVYNVDLPSGRVTDLGPLATPMHTNCESWAFWGVAEFFGASLYLTYVQSSSAIVRTRVPDGMTTTVANFMSLSDMCSFTVAPSRRRWYWHHEGSSQFHMGDESIGYCNATFDTTIPPAAYTLTMPTFEVPFIDACAAPGHTSVLPNQDDSAVFAPLPFTFRYWGRDMPAGTMVNVTSNGWFGFDGMMNNSLGGTLPDVTPPNATIAVHWGDDYTRSDGVCIATVGAAPRRSWVVEWSDTHYCCGDDGTVHLTYEAALSEGSNIIDFIYNGMRGVRPQTTGIENFDGTDAVVVCPVGMTCLIGDGSRYRFTPGS